MLKWAKEPCLTVEGIGGGRVPQTATHPLSVGTLLAEVQMLGGKSEDPKYLQSGESEIMNQTKLFITGHEAAMVDRTSGVVAESLPIHETIRPCSCLFSD